MIKNNSWKKKNCFSLQFWSESKDSKERHDSRQLEQEAERSYLKPPKWTLNQRVHRKFSKAINFKSHLQWHISSSKVIHPKDCHNFHKQCHQLVTKSTNIWAYRGKNLLQTTIFIITVFLFAGSYSMCFKNRMSM